MPGLGADLKLRQRPAAFDPGALFAGGAQGIWIDPSDTASLFQDSAGTIPAGVGDPIGRIEDRSGRGNHATQSAAASRPILRRDAIGSLYLEFDGIDDFLLHPFGIGAGDVTLSAAAQRTGGSDIQGLFSATPAATRVQVGLWAIAVAPSWGTFAAGTWRSAGFDASTRSLLSAVGRAAPDTHRLLTNGGNAAEIAGSYPGDADDRRAIGREYSSRATGHFTGRLYGLLGIGRALGEAELRQLIAWQAARAGIAT